MKQRPCIIVFAGMPMSTAAELYQMQLDDRADLVKSIVLKGDEDSPTVRQAMSAVLDLFTAERLQGLVQKGLLADATLRDVPVLIVIHHSNAPLVRDAAAALIAAVSDYANLGSKLRFATLVVSEAELGNARNIGKALTRSLDDLTTPDGVAFGNTVLLVCKERQGAPVSEASLAPILARLALILTTFDYDRDRSAFSVFWNSHVGGGGQVYFIGLIAYKVERTQWCAHGLLYREAASRLLTILGGNPVSMLADLRSDVFTSCVLSALGDTDPGVGLIKGSEEWIKLTDRYRTRVVPALLRQLLPNVLSLNELQCVLEAIRERVRPQTEPHRETSGAISLGIVLLGLDITGWSFAAFLSLVAAGVGVLSWKSWHGSPQVVPPAPPKPLQIPQSPVFEIVLDELLDQLSTNASGDGGMHESSGENWDSATHKPAQSPPVAGLPLCEVIFDVNKSESGVIAARKAAADAGKDAVRLLLMTKLRGGKWLSGERAADLNEVYTSATLGIEEAFLSDFIQSAERFESERGKSASIQDVLFAPILQVEQAHCFPFFGPGLTNRDNSSETCAVQNTINYLYMVV